MIVIRKQRLIAAHCRDHHPWLFSEVRTDLASDLAPRTESTF
jgi:hypothetical protein